MNTALSFTKDIGVLHNRDTGYEVYLRVLMAYLFTRSRCHVIFYLLYGYKSKSKTSQFFFFLIILKAPKTVITFTGVRTAIENK